MLKVRRGFVYSYLFVLGCRPLQVISFMGFPTTQVEPANVSSFMVPSNAGASTAFSCTLWIETSRHREMDQISQTWNIKYQTDQASRHPTYVPPKMVLPATTPTGKGFRESVTIVQSLKTKHVTDLIVALTDLIATFTALSHDRWSIP